MEYEKLSLVELKNYCKKRNLPYGGNKNKCGEKDKSQRIGKEREKGGVKNMYWSMGVFYYMVNKDFTFD